VVTGGLLVGYSARAPQKHQRSWARDLTNRRPVGAQFPASPRDRGLPPRMSGTLPQGLRMDFLQKLDRAIALAPEQRARIERIIAEGQERNKQLWNRVLPEMRRVVQATLERIREVLDPEQVKRFEELMRQRPQRKGDEPMVQPDRRLRDQPRRGLPPRERPLPETSPQPRSPSDAPPNS